MSLSLEQFMYWNTIDMVKVGFERQRRLLSIKIINAGAKT